MNLETIAHLSGVSRSTVSRVINNSPNVSEEARRRVLEVIRQTNFQPNLAARGLAAGSTRILGLVIPTGVTFLFVDPFFPQLIQGITSACNARDYSIMLWLADPEYERRTIRQVLYSGLVDGVILSSMPTGDPLVDALIEASRPFVVVGHVPGCDQISYVDVDNVESARQATLHLARLNRKRIATITGPQTMVVGQDRRQGYELALQQAGLPSDPSLIVEGDFTQEGGFQAMLRLLPRQPDATFAASDAMAQGALRALSESGKRVPEDVAVVGFDDMPFAAHTTPPLTTVRQPIQRMGSMAAETLIDIIESPASQPRCIRLPTELVIRASCGFTLQTGLMLNKEVVNAQTRN
jgi:LacI family transcriptional regulator